jgi:hypothetical protein
MSANLIVGKDPSGNKMPVSVDANGAVVISGTVSSIGNVEDILNSSLAVETVMAADVAATKASAASIAGLTIPAHDYMDLSYTGSNLTSVVYKTGGSSGTTVATLTLTYDGSNNLTSVAKS